MLRPAPNLLPTHLPHPRITQRLPFQMFVFYLIHSLSTLFHNLHPQNLLPHPPPHHQLLLYRREKKRDSLWVHCSQATVKHLVVLTAEP